MACVKCGIDVLKEQANKIEGLKIGLITNYTAVDVNLRSTIDILNEVGKLRCLFSPEHGVRGDLQAGVHVLDYVDERTGIKVYSLYGQTKKPTAEMLKDVDVLIFDIQDVGVRYYTYLYTMAYAMEAASELDKKFMVLDRPNPIGGLQVEGNVLDTRFSSFVGMYPIPIRYGLTIGELALLINEEFGIGCDVEVIAMEGWKRDMYYDETGLLWINPSPNIPSLDAAVLYSGTCLFEGTNISEGRGTTRPFEIIGAPWLDPYKLADEMNQKGLSGVIFRPVHFVPYFSKHKNELCKGVQIHVTDRKRVNAVEVGIRLLYTIVKMSGENFKWVAPSGDSRHYFIDYLAGTDELRLMKYEENELVEKWKNQSEEFKMTKEKYHIYQ
ncbi:exo-beta-N-acetylmuramidase NamZ family protein [Caldicoprobacter faecalis]|uniref:Uncharacterized conserved protein YbbC, DUF1343 family n=1 Tax=Caldicoprobacter faecalis TaxID=937334 RepID=A0A1I5SQJ6_9FIRM|nr:DUF1343 domain-containing protein [Caldicoprobacter faecalis]SFP72958.1 Uncharacterized conserved protein YbbC, DUF1343 family [Caldicoprobacter faecalis]